MCQEGLSRAQRTEIIYESVLSQVCSNHNRGLTTRYMNAYTYLNRLSIHTTNLQRNATVPAVVAFGTILRV